MNDLGDQATTLYINTSTDAARLLMAKYGDATHEVMVVIHIGGHNRVLATEIVATGTLDSADITVRDVFRGAFLSNAAAIILGHNHPGGNLAPSVADVATTRTLARAGELLGIPVLDHIIFTPHAYVSLREQADLAGCILEE